MARQPRPQVAPHAHCIVCGRAIATGENFCSQECQDALEAQRRRQRRTSWMFMAALGVLMLVWLFIFSRSVG